MFAKFAAAWKGMLERAIVTFVEVFAPAFVFTDLTTWKAAALGGAGAVLSLFYNGFKAYTAK